MLDQHISRIVRQSVDSSGGAAQVADRTSSLQQSGFLAIDRVASDADVAFITSCLHRLWRERTGTNEGAQFDLVGDGASAEMAYPQILKPSIFAPELLKTEFFQTATALAHELLGPKARFIGDHALLKPANVGPPTPWHQDEAFSDPAFEHDEISIWLALTPTTLENGCMQFIPGVYGKAPLLHRRMNDNPRIHAIECIADLDWSSAVACALPAGGATVHTCLSPHYTGPNVSAEDRPAYVLVFGLTPKALPAPRNAPWLATPSARDERERAWRQRGGVLVHGWRAIRRFDLRDRQQLAYIARRMRDTLRGLVKAG